MTQQEMTDASTARDDASLASFTIHRQVPPMPPSPSAPAPAADFRRALYAGTAGELAGKCAPSDRFRGHDGPAHTTQEVFHIRLADSSGHLEAAGLLIRKMYGWRGYAVEPDGATAGARITLLAECRGTVVGTMGLCLDSGLGLPADENFGEQLDLLRSQGRRLCEPSRLAIDAGMTKRVFASLIHVSYLYAHVLHGFSDYIIEVNPRHVAFYQRMLGFERVGAVRHCKRVAAPAVLLRLPLSKMGAHICACGGRPELQSEERSFYPFFFAPADEAGILSRLLARRCPE